MAIQTLIEWAKSHGATFSPQIQFEEIEKGNIGAFCAEAGSGFSINLPTKLAIKLSDAVAGLGPELAETCSKTRNVNCLLKMFLARERTNSLSFWAPYLSLLPSEFNSPYLWSPEEKQALQGSNLGSSLRENLAKIVDEWWLVVSVLPESLPKPDEHFVNLKFYYEHKFYTEKDMHQYLTIDTPSNWTSFPNYLWASMILKSRSFPSYLLKDCGAQNELDFLQEDVAMLLPLVDLLNHNPGAKVSWGGQKDRFVFESHDTIAAGQELFNNYGQKGNEELLLAYGFCLENNAADSVALKIKAPLHLLPDLESNGVKLPQISDYTTSVVNVEKKETPTKYEEYEDGLLFFVTKSHIPDNLVGLFQWLVKSRWEEKLSLRMQLSGLNHLRQAMESKSGLLDYRTVPDSKNALNIRIYLKSQKKILDGAVKTVKHMEKTLLADNKGKLLSLKNVYKRDVKFLRSLLVTMGVTSYEDILLEQLLDQVWLLYLVRCFNRKEYIKTEEDDEENYLPEWIYRCFVRMDSEADIEPAEVLQFRELYQNLIVPMNAAVPEIFNVGRWTVRELILSTKLLDTIGFVRGREQECILVNDFDET